MKNAEAVSTVLASATELAAPGSTIPGDSSSDPTPDFNIGYPKEQQLEALVTRIVELGPVLRQFNG